MKCWRCKLQHHYPEIWRKTILQQHLLFVQCICHYSYLWLFISFVKYAQNLKNKTSAIFVSTVHMREIFCINSPWKHFVVNFRSYNARVIRRIEKPLGALSKRGVNQKPEWQEEQNKKAICPRMFYKWRFIFNSPTDMIILFFNRYRHGMCFRGIHFILISTAHALFLTCLLVSIYGT